MTRSDNGVNDSDKKSAGRSLDYPNEPKNPRSIVTTDTGWQGFKDSAASLGLSASAYVELIGRNLAVLENPILYRFRSFLEQPISVFWCLSAAIHRYAQQFCHPDAADEEALQALVTGAIRRSMTIIAMIQYCAPDLYLRDLMPLLRWIAFKIILRQKKPKRRTSKKSPHLLITPNQQEVAIVHIHDSLQLLAQNSPAYYEILNMEFIGGLTAMQIAKYRRLNTQRQVTEADVRKTARDAIYQMRSYIHKNLYETLEGDVPSDPSFYLYEAKEYIALCARQYLYASEISDLEDFILKAVRNDESSGKYEFWLRECDHIAGHYWSKKGWDGSIHKSPSHKDVHYKIREQLEQEVFPKDREREGYIELRLHSLNKDLMKAKSRDKIKDILRSAISEESEDSFLFDDMPLPGAIYKKL